MGRVVLGRVVFGASCPDSNLTIVELGFTCEDILYMHRFDCKQTIRLAKTHNWVSRKCQAYMIRRVLKIFGFLLLKYE